MAGAELLWRMTNALVPWEFGKYGISFVMLAGLVRSGANNVSSLPIIYFGLLLPGLLPALVHPMEGEVRKALSYNLSGPFSVAACSAFLQGIPLDKQRARQLALSLALPVVSVAALVLLGIKSAENLEFGGQGVAKFEATGGFGPNQVSGLLGVGAFYAFLMALNLEENWRVRILQLGLSLWFTAHAAFSFSRTGIYMLAIGVIAVLPVMPRKWILQKSSAVIVALAVVGGIGVWSYLETLTEGKIGERFARTDTTGRDHIAMADIQIWADNPVFGVGVGMSSAVRTQMTGLFHASHIEYTRLLAEHGILGLVSGIILIGFVARPILSNLVGFPKAVVLAGVVMALSSLATSGMRTVMPCFLLGCAWLIGPATSSGRHQPRSRGTIR